MRWKQSGSIAAAAVVLFGLVGCVAEAPVTSDADAADQYEQLLAQSWVSTGQAGVEPPIVTIESALPTGEWYDALAVCMEDAGYPGLTFAYLPSRGFWVEPGQGGVSADIRPGTQTAFFECLSQHSFAASASPLLTTEQLDYIYDYYVTWLVPCLAQHDFTIRAALTREQYVEVGGDWSPYFEVNALLDDQTDYQALVDVCGTDHPALH